MLILVVGSSVRDKSRSHIQELHSTYIRNASYYVCICTVLLLLSIQNTGTLPG